MSTFVAIMSVGKGKNIPEDKKTMGFFLTWLFNTFQSILQGYSPFAETEKLSSRCRRTFDRVATSLRY